MSSTRSVGRGERAAVGDDETTAGTTLGSAAARAVPGPQAANTRVNAVNPAVVRLPIQSDQTPDRAGGLREGDRADGRAGGAAHLQGQADERELVYPSGRELFEVEVL